MIFFSKWRASFLYGKALMRFHQQRYKDSTELLEKICKLDSGHEQKEFYYCYLGRSYLGLEKYEDAFDYLSKAYDLFFKREQIIDENFEKKEFIEFIKAFCTVLKKIGQEDRSLEVARTAEKVIGTPL